MHHDIAPTSKLLAITDALRLRNCFVSECMPLCMVSLTTPRGPKISCVRFVRMSNIDWFMFAVRRRAAVALAVLLLLVPRVHSVAQKSFVCNYESRLVPLTAG